MTAGCERMWKNSVPMSAMTLSSGATGFSFERKSTRPLSELMGVMPKRWPRSAEPAALERENILKRREV